MDARTEHLRKKIVAECNRQGFSPDALQTRIDAIEQRYRINAGLAKVATEAAFNRQLYSMLGLR